MAATLDNVIRLGGTQLLRNPGLEPLELGQLKRFAPTIFQKRPIEGVSDSYGMVKTFEIIQSMTEHGYDCVEVRQSRRRDEERMPFTKHMLKFRRHGTIKSQLKRGDVIPQIVMLNSHDRSSGFHLYAGMFRLVCENGLMVSDGQFVEPLKVRHSMSMVEDIVNKSTELIKGADGVYSIREQMLSVPMNDRAVLAFARAALEFRPPRRAGVIDPPTLLIPRRPEDKVNDLWHVFNRVQENMMKGGATSTTAGNRTVQTKGIGRIERDVQVNSALWSLAVDTLNKAGKGTKSTKKSAARKASVDEVLE